MPDDLNNEDSLFEDVRAAYAEAASRSEGHEPEPVTDSEPAAESRPAPNEVTDEKRGTRRGPQKDERGRFVKRSVETVTKGEKTKEVDTGTEGPDEENDDPQPAEQAEKAAQSAGSPPPSWTVKSKSSWDQLPEHVRADIAKRETEIAQGLSALRDYKDLKPYADLAAKHNTTIKKALDHYTGIENVLKQDLGKGLAIIVQNYGLDQSRAAQLFASLAQQYGGQVPNHQRASQAPSGATPVSQPQPGDPLHNLLKPFLEPLRGEVTRLQQQLSSREAADRNASEQSLAKAIESFSVRPENRYFADLEETITRLFETGMVPFTGNHEGDLRTAYDTAAQMHPEVREALIEQRIREQADSQRQKEQEAAQKAKNASRSITGSRVPGTVTRQQPAASNGFDDIEADVRAAYRLHAQH